jgi:hypothetical protein
MGLTAEFAGADCAAEFAGTDCAAEFAGAADSAAAVDLAVRERVVSWASWR